MSLVDAKQRELATDPLNSYIVQAPAGSGKTEVLTQRYLRLLSTVQNPAEIICITFTKKAANEMRERILDSLHDANNRLLSTLAAESEVQGDSDRRTAVYASVHEDSSTESTQQFASTVEFQNKSNKVIPLSAHKEKTYEYATTALFRSAKLGWDILEQPNSLKIITIDSLCQSLANAIFVQESKTAFADICTNTQEIYQKAAENCLSYAAEDQVLKKYLEHLLAHVDNRQDNLLSLLSDLLNSRDTWLEPLFIAKYQDKETFEKAIQIIEKKAINNFLNCLDKNLQQEILGLIKKLYIAIGKNDSELFTIDSLNALNTSTADELCNLLLTSSNNLRKSFDHHIGLKKDACSDLDYKTLKISSKNLFEILENIPNFTDALIQIKNLPNPHYTEQQWIILQSLFNLLPLLVAHLNVYFNENNQVDFTGIANEALQSLGDDLNPTNLTLYLDNKIQHILIDEFQDTSLTQFKLLKKLVNGWQENDGRTLFIVGDPQQSIYRFRGAEVGLFLKAKLNGINNLKLIPLNLSCNFRSDGKIVNWVNTNFQNIFPISDNISSGAIKYSNSVAINQEKTESFIKAYQFENIQQEAIFITNTIIKELEENPKASIAILVRSRKQLSHIVNTIRENNLPYQGVDIDLLAKQWHIRDIHSLTQALLMPGNRLAWLSFLRSPFSGLNLEDILAIASFAPQKSIFYALTNLNHITNLSEDGLIRTNYIFNVLNNALNTRAQTDTVLWLKGTLKSLYSDFILTTKEEADLEQYWDLLTEFLHCGEIKNWSLFNEQLNNLYAKQSEATRLQIMTIHKAKGLEFDCVIIPGLGNKSSNQDNNLFRSLNLPDENGDDIFLFSPIKAAHEEQCKLYSYLKKLDEQKSNYELQRLLYVAITRAKTKLYLTDYNNKSIIKNSFRSFLSHINFENIENTEANTNETNHLPKLFKLPIDYYKVTTKIKEIKIPSLQYTINNDAQRIIGIVTHEILQWICNNHPHSLELIPWSLAKNRLLSFGITNNELEKSLTHIQQKIQNLYNDEIGKWLISKHINEKNEYELLVKNNDNYNTKIIDRTFNADDFLWIIDFKTGIYNQTTEKEYINQVNEYANALSHLTNNIKCGLYYLDTNYWYTWQYKPVYDVLIN